MADEGQTSREAVEDPFTMTELKILRARCLHWASFDPDGYAFAPLLEIAKAVSVLVDLKNHEGDLDEPIACIEDR